MLWKCTCILQYRGGTVLRRLQYTVWFVGEFYQEACVRVADFVPPSSLPCKLTAMQFYPGQPPAHFQGTRPEYAYPAGPVATSPRMNWSPTVHPGAWTPYDFSAAAAYQAGYPPTGDPRSPPYNLVEHSGTPHNIRDILGAQSSASLPSEVAKTAISYQKSPTGVASGVAVYAAEHHNLRSPTTPTSTPTHMHPPGKPFEVIYSEMPGSFYVPARPMLSGK